MEDVIIDQCKAIIVGCAIGDCIGVPFETMKYDQIQKIEERNSKPYLRASDYWSEYFVKKLQGKTFGPGMHTDDTQLTSAVCRAFWRWKPEEQDFHDLMLLMSEEHVTELEKPPCPQCWGGTVRALQRLKNFSHTYKDSGNSRTVGNGVLMKSIPLAYFYSLADPSKVKRMGLDHESRVKQVSIYNDMTHETPQHRISANVFIDFLVGLIRSKGEVLSSVDGKKRFLRELIENSIRYENEVFKQVLENPDKNAKPNKKYDTQYERLSDYLKSLLRELSEDTCQKILFHGLDDLTLIKLSKGGISVNIYSLTMVIGLVLSLPSKDCLDIEFVKRAAFIGGDTDTNAAMVGAIVGAVHGMSVFPQEYLDGLVYYKDIVKDGELFGRFMCSVVKK